ncbi:MAG: hypothetical protein ABIW38_01680 [Ferruginibacter sp.]
MTTVIAVMLFYTDLELSIFKMMKGIKLSKNLAIFLLFFGVAALEAFETSNWLMAFFWVVIGIFFLVSDNLKKA